MTTPLKQTRLNDPRKPSQADVARAAGINQGFYSRLETGDANASADTAARLAAYFGLSIDELFTPAMYSTASTEAA